MKNFTHILSVLLSFTIFYSTSAHATGKMRDMSLSVEETNRQLATPQKPRSNIADPGFYNDNNHGNNYDFDEYSNDGIPYNNNYTFDADAPISPNMANNLKNPLDNNLSRNGINPRRLPPGTRGISQRGFINKFCSTEYTPKDISSEAQQSCMDTQRQEACDRFQNAAVNIQRILSQAIDCEANSSGYSSSDCDGLDASRLDMLKQYWQDEDASYTILFLPDMVLNSAANCSANSRRSGVR